MNERVTGEKSLSKRALENAHAFARAEAERVYAQKKKLGSKQDAKVKLEELIKELDASLPLYKLKNDAMVRESLSLARKTYDAVVSSVCSEHARLCLHPGDLAELHAGALHNALTFFDSARDVADDEEDDQRSALVQSLEQQYDELCVVNEQNNYRAVLGALDLYVARMKLQMEHTGVSSTQLEAQNQKAREDALAFLAKQRNRTSELEKDPYVQKLLEKISSCFEEFEKTNINSNKTAMLAAESSYNNYVTTEWGPPNCCFHPQGLLALHKKAVDVAVKQFQANRANSEDDDYKEVLVKILEPHYSRLQKINKFNNEKSVEQAFVQYKMKMDLYTRPSLLSVVAPCLKKLANELLLGLPAHHKASKKLAITDFYSRRRGGGSYAEDEYLNELKQKIDAACEEYRCPLLSLFIKFDTDRHDID